MLFRRSSSLPSRAQATEQRRRVRSARRKVDLNRSDALCHRRLPAHPVGLSEAEAARGLLVLCLPPIEDLQQTTSVTEVDRCAVRHPLDEFADTDEEQWCEQ